jgi:hypothetical protein
MFDAPISSLDVDFSVNRIQAGFALRYINIFFTPSFVLLPLSPPISGIEVGKVIAVFSTYEFHTVHAELLDMLNVKSLSSSYENFILHPHSLTYLQSLDIL